jgi:hypothetical protein
MKPPLEIHDRYNVGLARNREIRAPVEGRKNGEDTNG